MKRVLGEVMVLAALAVLVVIYLAAGWHRMEYECATAPAMGTSNSVSFSWSWSPLGFHCEYADGRSTTELWY